LKSLKVENTILKLSGNIIIGGNFFEFVFVLNFLIMFYFGRSWGPGAGSCTSAKGGTAIGSLSIFCTCSTIGTNGVLTSSYGDIEGRVCEGDVTIAEACSHARIGAGSA
jgi:hypothetical protein